MTTLPHPLPRMHAVVSVTAIALAVLPLCAGRQPRNWQDGKLAMVQRPYERNAPPANPAGTATQMGGGKPSIPVLESTSGGETWIYVVAVAGKSYAATFSSPGRKSYLASLSPGQAVKVCIEKRSLYLLDPKGKEWKLRLVDK